MNNKLVAEISKNIEFLNNFINEDNNKIYKIQKKLTLVQDNLSILLDYIEKYGYINDNLINSLEKKNYNYKIK